MSGCLEGYSLIAQQILHGITSDDVLEAFSILEHAPKDEIAKELSQGPIRTLAPSGDGQPMVLYSGSNKNAITYSRRSLSAPFSGW